MPHKLTWDQIYCMELNKMGDQGLVFLNVFVHIQKLTVIQNKVFRDN